MKQFLSFENNIYSYYDSTLKKWGFRAFNGEIAISAFTDVKPIFNEGFYYSSFGAISRQGLFINTSQYTKSSKYIIYDTLLNGDYEILRNGDSYPNRTVEPFCNGLSVINKTAVDNSHDVLVNVTGEHLFKFSEDLMIQPTIFSENEWARLRYDNEASDGIDLNGWYIEPDGMLTYEPFNGSKLLYIASDGKKFIIINNQREPVFSMEGYTDIRSFSNGFASVKRDGKWGVINEQGDEIIPCIYVDVEVLNDGNFDVIQQNSTIGKYGWDEETMIIMIPKSKIDSLPEYFKRLIYKCIENAESYVEFKNDNYIVDICQWYEDMDETSRQRTIESAGGCEDEVVDKDYNEDHIISDGVNVLLQIAFILNASEMERLIINKNGEIIQRLEYINIRSLVNSSNIFSFELKEDNFEGEFLLIDSQFNQITECVYQRLENIHSENFIIAKMNDYYGIINKNGSIVTEFIYDHINVLYKGKNVFLARLKMNQSLINLDTGSITELPVNLMELYPCGNDCYFSWDEDGNYLVIDDSGTVITTYNQISNFRGHYDYAYRYIGQDGYLRLVICNQELGIRFKEIREIGDDLLLGTLKATEKHSKGCNEYVIIDKNSVCYPIEKGLYVESFKGEFGIVSDYINGEDRYGFINRQGRLVIPPIYEMVRHFSEKMAAVKLNGMWGFINESGDYVIPITLDIVVRSFFNSRAWVVYLGEMFQIDNQCVLYKKNQAIFQIPYLIPKIHNDLYGYVNKEGAFVIQPIFSNASFFNSDFANVTLNGIEMIINDNGKIITTQLIR